MAFEDFYRLSAHAVITDGAGRVLLLKSTYGSLAWGLPGGALDPGETIHDCIRRECIEELGQAVRLGPLTGVYFHRAVQSHAFIFRAALEAPDDIRLSAEHSEHRWFALDELSAVQRARVEDCLRFDGQVASAKF
jgi:8-oxo-dGTP pyrophosphatase MutT (NUDIX family)